MPDAYFNTDRARLRERDGSDVTCRGSVMPSPAMARETGAAVLLGEIVETTPKAASAILNKKAKQFNTPPKAITGSKIPTQFQILLTKEL
jgi:hypothetical protein